MIRFSPKKPIGRRQLLVSGACALGWVALGGCQQRKQPKVLGLEEQIHQWIQRGRVPLRYGQTVLVINGTKIECPYDDHLMNGLLFQTLPNSPYLYRFNMIGNQKVGLFLEGYRFKKGPSLPATTKFLPEWKPIFPGQPIEPHVFLANFLPGERVPQNPNLGGTAVAGLGGISNVYADKIKAQLQRMRSLTSAQTLSDPRVKLEAKPFLKAGAQILQQIDRYCQSKNIRPEDIFYENVAAHESTHTLLTDFIPPSMHALGNRISLTGSTYPIPTPLQAIEALCDLNLFRDIVETPDKEHRRMRALLYFFYGSGRWPGSPPADLPYAEAQPLSAAIISKFLQKDPQSSNYSLRFETPIGQQEALAEISKLSQAIQSYLVSFHETTVLDWLATVKQVDRSTLNDLVAQEIETLQQESQLTQRDATLAYWDRMVWNGMGRKEMDPVIHRLVGDNPNILRDWGTVIGLNVESDQAFLQSVTENL